MVKRCLTVLVVLATVTCTCGAANKPAKKVLTVAQADRVMKDWRAACTAATGDAEALQAALARHPLRPGGALENRECVAAGRVRQVQPVGKQGWAAVLVLDGLPPRLFGVSTTDAALGRRLRPGTHVKLRGTVCANPSSDLYMYGLKDCKPAK
jgi:hypothetical protein